MPPNGTLSKHYMRYVREGQCNNPLNQSRTRNLLRKFDSMLKRSTLKKGVVFVIIMQIIRDGFLSLLHDVSHMPQIDSSQH